MKGFLSIKTILVTVAILVIFGNTILSIIGDVAYGIRTGDWNKLVTDVGATIFSADSRILDAVTQLSNPFVIDSTYLTFLKMQLFFSLASLFIYIWLVYKGLSMIAMGTKHDFGTKIMVVLFAIIIIGVAQMIYTFSIGKFQMPYSGLWSFITNPGVIAQTIDYVSNEYIPKLSNNTSGG